VRILLVDPDCSVLEVGKELMRPHEASALHYAENLHQAKVKLVRNGSFDRLFLGEFSVGGTQFLGDTIKEMTPEHQPVVVLTSEDDSQRAKQVLALQEKGLDVLDAGFGTEEFEELFTCQ
jgi:hypothetical protein